MELKKYSYTITEKMQSIPVTSEARLFYRSNCEMQADYIEEQQDNGIDPPNVKLDDILILLKYKISTSTNGNN